MQKILFFDCRELEQCEGFERQLEQPVKHPGSPLLIADQPWENGNFTLYGSVVRVPGRPFQLWYSVVQKPWWIHLAYAESDDGLAWRRPALDIYRHKGRKTNIVLTDDVHGPAVIYDPEDPREDCRYKLLAGIAPSGLIRAYRSADGIHWQPVSRFPAIPFNPDCPMGLVRAANGRYAAYHRTVYGRRVCRSESWDFRVWAGEPRMVLEPDAGDPPQIQFYGLGSAAYGSYEIGTLWMFHTDPKELRSGHMNGYQEAEFAYARSGYAWHRAAQGRPFIPHGGKGKWDRGNLQAASQPVYLDDEIRYYYAGANINHATHWELRPQRAGLGMAGIKPDRFIALAAGPSPAVLMTVAFRLSSPDIFINARVARNGWIRAELLDENGKPLPGWSGKACQPITGDSLAHPLRWQSSPRSVDPVQQRVRLRLTARHAGIYSIFVTEPNETPVYHRFQAVAP